MNTTLLGIALSMTLLGIGCGTDYTVSAQPLAGVIGGQSWTFVAGDTSEFLSDDDGFFVALYAEAVEPCGFSTGQTPHMLLSVPTAPGSYDMGLQRTATFVAYDSEGPVNLIATEGVIRVDEITSDTITGGIHTEYDGDNVVDGEFEVVICPPST